MLDRYLVKTLRIVRHGVAWIPKLLLYGLPILIYLYFCLYRYNYSVPWSQIDIGPVNMTNVPKFFIENTRPTGILDIFIIPLIIIFMTTCFRICNFV